MNTELRPKYYAEWQVNREIKRASSNTILGLLNEIWSRYTKTILKDEEWENVLEKDKEIEEGLLINNQNLIIRKGDQIKSNEEE